MTRGEAARAGVTRRGRRGRGGHSAHLGRWAAQKPLQTRPEAGGRTLFPSSDQMDVLPIHDINE